MAQLCWLQSDHAKQFYKEEYSHVISKLYELLISAASWETLQNVGVNVSTRQFFTELFLKETFGSSRNLSEKLMYLAM